MYAGLRIENFPSPKISAEILTPANCTDDSPTILYAHGGGYGFGSVSSYRRFASVLAWRLCSRMVLFDYRLAPEHPFPAALEDAGTVYEELLKFVSPEKLIVAGDSAGGGLAIATLLQARDQQLPLPAKVFLLSPWVDLTVSSPSTVTNDWRDAMLKSRYCRLFAENYVGAHSPENPMISPVYADLSGLPPMLVFVGSNETLLDDAKNLQTKACAQGVDASLIIYQGMHHVWPIATPRLKKAKDFYLKVNEFLQRSR